MTNILASDKNFQKALTAQRMLSKQISSNYADDHFDWMMIQAKMRSGGPEEGNKGVGLLFAKLRKKRVIIIDKWL